MADVMEFNRFSGSTANHASVGQVHLPKKKMSAAQGPRSLDPAELTVVRNFPGNSRCNWIWLYIHSFVDLFPTNPIIGESGTYIS